jgi:hypothetical protein
MQKTLPNTYLFSKMHLFSCQGHFQTLKICSKTSLFHAKNNVKKPTYDFTGNAWEALFAGFAGRSYAAGWTALTRRSRPSIRTL